MTLAGVGCNGTTYSEGNGQEVTSHTSEPDTTDADSTEPDSDDIADAQDVDETEGETRTGGAPHPNTWQVYVSEDAPDAVKWTAEDVVGYLEQWNWEASITNSSSDVSCEPDMGQVVFRGNGLTGHIEETSWENDQTWRVSETRCSGGAQIELAGGGLKGRQYAAYEWLHEFGVRFFHPEQEYVPQIPQWSGDPLEMKHTPDFKFRKATLHLTHPLPQGDAFKLGEDKYMPEARRYIDWQIKNKASDGQEGAGNGDLSNYGRERGFPHSTGMNLYEQQQGSSNVIDPDSPKSEETQIAEAIDQRMQGTPKPDMFHFSFNPSEFTEIKDTKVVDQMNFIANYFEDNYPDTILKTTNHGTAGEPTENYGVRYYDLPKFAPDNLGVSVHTLMFFDLFRPAPVYGNENFNNLYNFMAEEYQDRRIWHFPEAAWWLTFDIPVPLYLPITIEARSRDISGISYMLDGKLVGHTVFGTGHEWGYWQNEYCSYRMAANVEYDWRDCLEDITSPTLGVVADTVQQSLEKIIEYQERDLIYGDVLRWIVGSDSETEVASQVGIKFHPLPPTPNEIMKWDIDKINDWKNRVRPQLKRMDRQYQEVVDTLNQEQQMVPPGGGPWFREIRDGVQVTGLRARWAWQIYEALVLLRESQIKVDSQLKQLAENRFQSAKTTTEKALEVIHRREEDYRYEPLSRYIAGGPEGTEDDNWTIYDYRYLNRTHHGFYYKRVNEMAQKVFEGSDKPVTFSDAILGPDQSLTVQVQDDEISNITTDLGDGTQKQGKTVEHTYGSPGVYEIQVSGSKDESDFSAKAKVASVSTEVQAGFNGTIVEPQEAKLIESVLPAVTLGEIDGSQLAVGFGTASAESISVDRWIPADRDSEASELTTKPTELVVPIVNRSTGDVRTSVTVQEAVISHQPSESRLNMDGKLSTQSLINAVVSIGGFDRQGARQLIAQQLGYTPDTLPETLTFEANFALKE
jgi:hypothetical protein